MKIASKTIFSHFLLGITFNDKFEDLVLVIYIWVLKHNNKGHHEKLFNLFNILLLFLGIWPKKL